MALTQKVKKKSLAADRKRHGQHHRTSKVYSKTYWPYLPMLAIVLAGMVLNMSWHASQGLLGYATSMGSSSLLSYTNKERTSRSVGALAINSELSVAAQNKANDMATRDYWSHVTPDGKQPWSFIVAAGYEYQAAGENLAYGFSTSSETVTGWMNSPDHRANILNSSYSEVGFGIANAADYQGDGPQTIVVAMYASPIAVAAVPEPAPTPAPTATQPKKVAPATTKETKQTTAPTPAPTPAPAPTVSQQKPTATTTDSNTLKDQSQIAVANNEQIKQELSTKEIARIDVMTNGNMQWASLALSAIATISIIGFVAKHGRLWRKYILRGEAFIIHHPVLDIALVAISVLGFVLTRASGFIQ